jgi:ribosomal protein S18 acetylase RimI-like enzyme
MKISSFLQITPVKHTEFLLFGLLVFKFFRTPQNKNILLLGIPKVANSFIIFLYIFKFGLLNLRRERYFVRLDNHFVGTFSIDETPNSIHLYSLTINPQWRQRGIATYILNYVEARAICGNKNWLYLSVGKTNYPAIRLYKDFGFIRIEESKWFFLLRKMIGKSY